MIEKAEDYHSKGYQAWKQGDYRQAIHFYDESLKIKPDYFKALFNRGFAYDKLGEYDNAIKDYSSAI